MVCDPPKGALKYNGFSCEAGSALRFKSYMQTPKSADVNSNLAVASPIFNGRYSKLKSPYK